MSAKKILGQQLKDYLRINNIDVTKFAKDVGISRTNVYYLFGKKSFSSPFLEVMKSKGYDFVNTDVEEQNEKQIAKDEHEPVTMPKSAWSILVNDLRDTHHKLIEKDAVLNDVNDRLRSFEIILQQLLQDKDYTIADREAIISKKDEEIKKLQEELNKFKKK